MTCALRARADGRLDEIPHNGWANRLQRPWFRRWEVWQVRADPDGVQWCAVPLSRHWRRWKAFDRVSTVSLILIANGVEADQTVAVLRRRRGIPTHRIEFLTRVEPHRLWQKLASL